MRKTILTVGSSALERRIHSQLSEFVIGQDRAKKQIARTYLSYHSRFLNPRGPAGRMFLLGPTGVGKTELVQAFANFLIGDRDGYTHVSCGNFMTDREVWGLIGSAKGHIGSEIKPRFSQEIIDAPDIKRRTAQIEEIKNRIESLSGMAGAVTPKRRAEIIAQLESAKEELSWVENSGFVSIVLFDEFEKAHYSLQNAILDLLDKGIVRLNSNGDPIGEHRNREIDHLAENEKLNTSFRNTFVFFTSNLASGEIEKMLTGRRMGFQSGAASLPANIDRRVYSLAIAALKKRLIPELFGRISKENVVVCHALSEQELMGVLELQIEGLRLLIAACKKPFKLLIDQPVKEYLLREACDDSNIGYGGRAVVSVVKKRISDPLSRIFLKSREEGGIDAGDKVSVELDHSGRVCFMRLDDGVGEIAAARFEKM